MISMDLFERPVIILGHGVRAANADAERLLEMRVPILTTWQGMDLVDNFHPMYFGRTGIYGQRCANKILYEASHIIAIGARLCPWGIGHAGFRPEQRITMVDIDEREAAKFKNPKAELILMDAAAFVREFDPTVQCASWLKQCERWREQWDWIEHPTHDDTNGYINSYQLMRRLEPYLHRAEVIVVDTGSLMCPVFQALRVRPPQRVITAGGLGEMGNALPGAVGASFARNKGEVLAFIGDGGMMMNLQELATVRHHSLPIKMMVFENDGYSMIKGTFANVGKPRRGVDKASGLSFPDFQKVARAFGIASSSIRDWAGFDAMIPTMLAEPGPFLLQVHIDPEQLFMPRLKPVIKDGVITPARFDQLSPLDA
jgi:acetolactate synthase-1/2/3 large subunit